MANYKADDIRTIALVGHEVAGKTSLADALLFKAKAVERRGTDPELAGALREALDKSSPASESGTEGAERQRLQRQLSVTHEKLVRTRAKLEVSRTKTREIAERNRLLTARFSARRYVLVDTFVGLARRIPGIESLVRREGKGD